MDVYVVIILLISPLFFLQGSVIETQAVKIRWIEMINDENRLQNRSFQPQTS